MNQGIGPLTQYVKSAVQLHPAVGGDQSVRPTSGEDPFADSVRLSISAAGRSLAGKGTDAPYEGPSDPMGVTRGRASAQQTLAPMRQEGTLFQQNASRLELSAELRKSKLESAPKEPPPTLPRPEPQELNAPRKEQGLTPPIPEAQPRERTQPLVPKAEPPQNDRTNLFNLVEKLNNEEDSPLLKKTPPEENIRPERATADTGNRLPYQPPSTRPVEEEVEFKPVTPLDKPAKAPEETRKPAPEQEEKAPPPTPAPSTVGETRTLPNASDMALSRASQVSALRTYSQVAGFGSQNDASQGTPFARVA